MVAVATGGSHSCALSVAGGVKCWGQNSSGQLGDATNVGRSTPVDVVSLSSGVTAIAVGDGAGTGRRCQPITVSGLPPGLSAIAAGGQHTCALAAAGKLMCLGANISDQLGDGTTVGRPRPVTVNMSATPNYQGLWWAAGGAESGWGIKFAHQGDVIFVAWFTYDATGKTWWLTMTADKTEENVDSGTLFQTRGPAFNTVSFDPNLVRRTATFTMTNGNAGTLDYQVADGANLANQTKAITRQVFRASGTVCH